MSEKFEALARTGGVNCSLLKPNFSASSSIFFWPRVEPILPNTVLQDQRSASRIVAFLQGGMLPSLGSGGVVVPGMIHGSGESVCSSAEVYRPFSSAAAAVTTLKVEPGG